MKNLIHIIAVFLLVGCTIDKDFEGFPLVGKEYPYKPIFPESDPKISNDFMAPSPGGEFFEPFQEINVQYITSDKIVFRIIGTRTYINYESCENERKKLWDLARGYFADPKDDGQGNWEFNAADQVLNIFCGVPQGSPHAFLSVIVTDVPLINKQVQMHLEAAKH